MAYLKKAEVQKTDIIVWIGKNSYWNRVYINPQDNNRLYIEAKTHDFQPLDNYHIREIGHF